MPLEVHTVVHVLTLEDSSGESFLPLLIGPQSVFLGCAVYLHSAG